MEKTVKKCPHAGGQKCQNKRIVIGLSMIAGILLLDKLHKIFTQQKNNSTSEILEKRHTIDNNNDDNKENEIIEDEIIDTSIVRGSENTPGIYLRTKYSKGINKTWMAQIGLGTWLSKPGDVKKAVQYAIKIGYKHIDTAYIYGNESEIGDAIKQSGIDRDDIFITTKLWNTMHNPKIVEHACKLSLKNLKIDYIDLYLMHWPMCFEEGEDNGEKVKFPKNKDGTVKFGNIIYSIVDTWKAMENLVEKGLVKHIGLANFNIKQIQMILDNCTIKPIMNQCESHPYLNQNKLIEFCKKNNIHFTGYSPLGSPARPESLGQELPILMEDNTIKDIANRRGLTVAQILIKWQIQRGNVVIPKSVTPKRIRSNLDVWNFDLTEIEMKTINDIGNNIEARYCFPQIKINGKLVARDAAHPFFPF